MYSAHQFPCPIVWVEKNDLSKRVSYFRKSADFNVFCHFPLLIHSKIPHREGMLFGLEEYWRLGALSSVTDLTRKFDRKVCRIRLLLILIPLNLTVRITKPLVSPRQWLRKITAHWVLSNANGPMGDLTEQDGSPAFLPPSHVPSCSVLLSPILHPRTRKAGRKKWTHILSFFSSSLLL